MINKLSYRDVYPQQFRTRGTTKKELFYENNLDIQLRLYVFSVGLLLPINLVQLNLYAISNYFMYILVCY